ncbi:hypothetical protein SAMN05444920_13074 [Nonomuraea solani]|uniref:Uncharacterized protein n=1 Tax=Nonomuraea solani TaxID=1144553 RepID=A0A1H6EY88_9ACTN|nr:hypothetical protein [Nonomuraea solani]SEH02850.1 hypothetical protein SAMN05444920_13074 [Nonomuraea solani]
MAFSVLINVVVMIVLGGLLAVGAGLMFMRRQEHGRGAVLGATGCVVLLLGVIISGVFSIALPSLVSSFGDGYTVLIVAYNLISLLFQVVGTGLLIFGVIARRNPPQEAQQAQGAWNQPQQPGWNQPQGDWNQPQPPQQPPAQQPGWQQPGQPPFNQG